MARRDDEPKRDKMTELSEMRYTDVARRLALAESRIAQRLTEIEREDSDSFEALEIYFEEDKFWIFGDIPIGGLDLRIVSFCHERGETSKHQQKLGIDSRSVLYVESYPDEETLTRLKRVHGIDTFPQLFSDEESGTYYFVDESGNYSKLVSIPQRKTADGLERSVTLQVPMLPRDLAIMGAVLNFFQEKVGVKSE